MEGVRIPSDVGEGQCVILAEFDWLPRFHKTEHKALLEPVVLKCMLRRGSRWKWRCTDAVEFFHITMSVYTPNFNSRAPNGLILMVSCGTLQHALSL